MFSYNNKTIIPTRRIRTKWARVEDMFKHQACVLDKYNYIDVK